VFIASSPPSGASGDKRRKFWRA